MAVVLSRIDDRLIHGQILEVWVPFLNVDCIVVANDEVASMTLRQTIMRAAIPKGTRVFFEKVAGLGELFSRPELRERRVLMLFAGSGDALKAFRLGVGFSEVNLGNLHADGDADRVSCTVWLYPEDIDNLNALEKEGVKVVSQCVPSDRRQSWKELIGERGRKDVPG
ncbi:MAG: PTS sugar transporter subunit IIB [Deltaproteobacteria bacterium]|nr:PTS sugar transporter subunit IIB [Deltaproteobacteria bacterium]